MVISKMNSVRLWDSKLLVHAHSLVTASRNILEITKRNDNYFTKGWDDITILSHQIERAPMHDQYCFWEAQALRWNTAKHWDLYKGVHKGQVLFQIDYRELLWSFFFVVVKILLEHRILKLSSVNGSQKHKTSSWQHFTKIGHCFQCLDSMQLRFNYLSPYFEFFSHLYN